MTNPSKTKADSTISRFNLFTGPDHQPRFAASDLIAAALGLVWLALVGGFFLFANSGTGSGGAFSMIMVLVAIFMPIALIWVVAVTARTARDMRADALGLQRALGAMREAYENQMPGAHPSVERKLEEIATAAKQAETAIATFTSRRDTEATQPSADRKAALINPVPPHGDEQRVLALGTPAEDMKDPVSVDDFIRALNFPDSQTDKDNIRALRRALEDRSLAKLIRAAQDVLNLLGEDGIYMDDLLPDRAKPEIWRRFASGDRGKAIAALGGVRDRSSLALASGRMRTDTIFRDAAHHFLRQFDKTVAEFEKNATDQEIVALAGTRTAKAFMLLGRVTGTFD